MSYSHRRLGKLVHTGRPDDCHYHATIVSPLQRARYSSSLQLISALLNQSRFTRPNFFISLVSRGGLNRAQLSTSQSPACVNLQASGRDQYMKERFLSVFRWPY